MDSLREKTARGARWSEFLSAFQHTVRYKKGSSHGNADGPSRNPIPASNEDLQEQQREQLLEAYALRDGDVQQQSQSSTSCDRSYKAARDMAWCEYIHLLIAIDEALADVAEEAAADAAAADSGGHAVNIWSSLAQHEALGLMTAADWQRAQEDDEQLAAIIAHLQGDAVADTPVGTAAAVRRWARDCELRDIGSAQLLMRLEWASSDVHRTGEPLCSW